MPSSAECTGYPLRPVDPPSLAVIALKGVVLGWSVAWIPGPVNTEMLRRGLRWGPRSAFLVGLGATSGDFLWALAVSAGVAAVAGAPGVERGLAAGSALLLVLLGLHLARAALRAARASRSTAGAVPAGTEAPTAPPSPTKGFLLGFTMAALSPFNVAFWLGFMGQDAARGVRGAGMLVLAVAVVVGALAWCTVLCGALRLGARFSSPRWEVLTEGLAAALMLGFGLRMALAPGLWAF